jgi:single-stranded-DNA-specific exonuclease
MDKAAQILVDALERRRPLVVFADYDVDGATSAALLVRWFRAMGHELPVYVPDRMTEGYGPSPAAFRRIREQGAELVVTVDCGAAAHDAIDAAAEIGLEVVVGRPPPDARRPAPGRRRGQPQPPGLQLGAGEPRRRRRHLRAAGRPEPRGATARSVRRPGRARPAGLARPRRPRAPSAT